MKLTDLLHEVMTDVDAYMDSGLKDGHSVFISADLVETAAALADGTPSVLVSIPRIEIQTQHMGMLEVELYIITPHSGASTLEATKALDPLLEVLTSSPALDMYGFEEVELSLVSVDSLQYPAFKLTGRVSYEQ